MQAARKLVRFSPTLESVSYTYSPTDYDRSCFSFPSPPPSPSLTTSVPTHAIAATRFPSAARPEVSPLDLSVITNASRRRSTRDSAKTHRPKLSIDTRSVDSPLFYTSMSTHYKCRPEEDDDGHLIPLTATC